MQGHPCIAAHMFCRHTCISPTSLPLVSTSEAWESRLSRSAQARGQSQRAVCLYPPSIPKQATCTVRANMSCTVRNRTPLSRVRSSIAPRTQLAGWVSVRHSRGKGAHTQMLACFVCAHRGRSWPAQSSMRHLRGPGRGTNAEAFDCVRKRRRIPVPV
jgi:hypothetical protein